MPHRRLADDLEADAVGLLRQEGEVLQDLRIRRQLAIGADLEAEELLRRGHRLRGGRRGQDQAEAERGQETDELETHGQNPLGATEGILP